MAVNLEVQFVIWFYLHFTADNDDNVDKKIETPSIFITAVNKVVCFWRHTPCKHGGVRHFIKYSDHVRMVLSLERSTCHFGVVYIGF